MFEPGFGFEQCVRLGPNARIGDARVTAILTRPNRPVLRDVETMRVVTRAR